MLVIWVAWCGREWSSGKPQAWTCTDEGVGPSWIQYSHMHATIRICAVINGDFHNSTIGTLLLCNSSIIPIVCVEGFGRRCFAIGRYLILYSPLWVEKYFYNSLNSFRTFNRLIKLFFCLLFRLADDSNNLDSRCFSPLIYSTPLSATLANTLT